MLLAPGFVTDVLALLVLFPPTRLVFRRMLMARASRGSVILGGFGPMSSGGGDGTRRRHMPGDFIDTDGTEPRGEI
jgi:UPF0716 family protein affecting phage T7 exclusion